MQLQSDGADAFQIIFAMRELKSLYDGGSADSTHFCNDVECIAVSLNNQQSRHHAQRKARSPDRRLGLCLRWAEGWQQARDRAKTYYVLDPASDPKKGYHVETRVPLESAEQIYSFRIEETMKRLLVPGIVALMLAACSVGGRYGYDASKTPSTNSAALKILLEMTRSRLPSKTNGRTDNDSISQDDQFGR